jgi:hypothetical protein
VGSALVGDRLPHGAADRLEGESVLSRDLGRVIEGEGHDQDGDGRRAEETADDEQVAAIASALARRRLLPLLLPQRLQLLLGPGHCPSLSQTDMLAKPTKRA